MFARLSESLKMRGLMEEEWARCGPPDKASLLDSLG